jgi:hypothetical protein
MPNINILSFSLSLSQNKMVKNKWPPYGMKMVALKQHHGNNKSCMVVDDTEEADDDGEAGDDEETDGDVSDEAEHDEAVSGTGYPLSTM